MRSLIFIACLLLASGAWGNIVQLDTVTVWPYSIQDDDTVMVDGDTTTSALLTVPAKAIHIGAVSGWLLLLGDSAGTTPDTLEFNSGGSSDTTCITMSGGFTCSGEIRGGYIRHHANTGADCKSISWQTSGPVTITGTQFYIQGDGCSGIESKEHDGFGYNHLIRFCQFYNNADNHNRFAKEVCNIKMGDYRAADTTQSGFEYHLRVEGCSMDGPHMLVYCGGWVGEAIFQMVACTLNPDGYNASGSWANNFAFGGEKIGCYGSYQSYVMDNRFVSGTSHGGGPGILMEFCKGEYGNEILIRNNYFDCHAGDNGENDFCRVIRARWGNDNIKIDSNNINGSCKTVASGSYGTEVSCIWVTTSQEDAEGDSVDIRCDSTTIRHNTIIASYADAGGTGAICRALLFEHEGDAPLTNLFVEENFLQSDGIIVTGGFSNWGCQSLALKGDTLKLGSKTHANSRTYQFGFNYIPETEDSLAYFGTGNRATDITYQNGAGDGAGQINLIDVENHDCSAELMYLVSLGITVVGSDDIPVVGADVWAVNAYGDTVVRGVTDGDGWIVDTTAYQFFVEVDSAPDCVDSTTYNDFTLGCNFGADTTAADSTVAWDTKDFVLKLTSTGGGAVYGGEIRGVSRFTKGEIR